jgi:phosphotransferase family enzyme
VPMHADQLTVTVETVRALVDQQFPEWAPLPVERVESEGTVNAIFRIGDRLAARFPLQPGDVAATRRWLESEADAARELLGRTRFPVPEPVALGQPGPGYPLPWSVQTWLPGTTATEQDPGTPPGSPTTWPSSSTTSVPSTPVTGRSAATAAEATCGLTTSGWRSASPTAGSCSTSGNYAGSGETCASCRAPPATR